MNMITRLIRLLKAIIHSVIDRMEDSRLLLKQGFRDMEDALAQKEARLKQLHASRQQIQGEKAEFVHEIDKLEQDVTTAIQKGKDDIARFLLKRIQALTLHREEMGNDLHTLDERIAQLHTCLTNQQYRYQQIHLRAETYLRRTTHERLTHVPFPMFPISIHQPSEEEIELELLQRKEAFKGGV